MTDKQFNLAGIVTADEFLKELYQAAVLSYENNKESGFSAYTDESLSRLCINQAVLGGEHSASSDMVIGHEHESQKGYFVPAFHYRLIHLHFHPPNTSLHPSHGDIYDYFNSRIANTNLREDSCDFQRDIFEDEEESKQIGYEIDYVNPISIIGLTKDNPQNINLLVYQGKTEEAVTFGKFCEFFAEYFSLDKLFGALVIEKFGFLKTGFQSMKQIVNFLNASPYLRAAKVKIKKGKLSPPDLEKLEKFELIQTRFFPEEADYSDIPLSLER